MKVEPNDMNAISLIDVDLALELLPPLNPSNDIELLFDKSIKGLLICLFVCLFCFVSHNVVVVIVELFLPFNPSNVVV